MLPSTVNLYIQLTEYISENNQQAIYQWYRRFRTFEEDEIVQLLPIIYSHATTVNWRAIVNLVHFYRALISSKTSYLNLIKNCIEVHHIELLTSRISFSDFDFASYLLKNITLAKAKGCFDSVNAKSQVQSVVSLRVKIFCADGAEDRHVIRYHIEMLKMLSEFGLTAELSAVLRTLKTFIRSRLSILESLRLLVDINDIKPRTAFVPNYPEELLPLLSLLIIQASLAVMSSEIDFHDLLDLTTLRFTLGLTQDDQIYPLFFKIFATDTDALYEVLNLMLTKQMHPLLDPLKFYSVMVHGSMDGKSFCENHVHRNPEGLKFVVLMLKRINLQGLMRNDTTSIKLHSGLRDCLIEMNSRGLLHFNPAPILKQLNLYLQF